MFPIENETMQDKFGFFNRHYLEFNDYLKESKPLPLSFIEFNTMLMWRLNGNELQKVNQKLIAAEGRCHV